MRAARCCAKGVLAVLLLVGSPAAPAAEQKAVDFTRDVRPILQARCAGCHGVKKQRGGLRLDCKDRALAGGDSGAVIVPGRAADSLLIRRVSSDDEAERMPADGERLSAEQVRLLRDWIDQGAAWPDDTAEAMHWAFRPVHRPPLPAVADIRWPRNAIDLFILARLEKEGLRPSPEADRRTLIRRLSFDLLGLPPAPEEIEAFVSDRDPLAYEKLVERLLASPAYGERWARHWLDVVRFAESHGFEMNQARPNAWPYRDWVIRSLNDDMPYDRFVREQIAGDALGADAATGFLVGGPWDQVKSPDIVLTAQQRADELHDMVSTTASTFLGLTLGCARCHNHKFDPITQADYYSVTAVFAGVQHGERPLRSDDADSRLRMAERLRRERQAIEVELARYRPRARPGGPAVRPAVTHQANEDRFAPVEARFLRFTTTATSTAEPCLDEVEVFTAESSPRNIALASLGTRATASGTLAGFAIHKLEHVNDGLYGNSHSWIADAPTGWVQLEFPQAVRIDRVVWSRDRSGSANAYRDRLAVGYRIEVSTNGRDWTVVADSSDRLPVGARLSTPSVEGLPPAQAAEVRRLAARAEELDREITGLSVTPRVYAGQFVQPGPTYRLHRGDPMQPREVVRPGALASFGARLELKADLPEQQRRLALAQWITDPAHPLTARVMVNRLWHYHFGEGLASTPSDFGVNGARPSHPELLDFLAAQLVVDGWGLKALHRRIVTSATYRQSSVANARGLQMDAGGRLLWRYPPRRLEAEALRDTILAVCGNLDRRMGGPGFDLFEPNDNYVKVYTPRTTFGPAQWRRMVYQSKPRMQLDGVFGAFDCPDAGQIAPRRTRSTTPLQALNLLNSGFTLQQADRFAERLRREAGSDPAAQVRRAFRLALGREPETEELTAAASLIRGEGLAIFCRALLNANEFVTIP
jgi:mono/diheme cytochrome c family protein